jgi:hypothetical protein
LIHEARDDAALAGRSLELCAEHTVAARGSLHHH